MFVVALLVRVVKQRQPSLFSNLQRDISQGFTWLVPLFISAKYFAWNCRRENEHMTHPHISRICKKSLSKESGKGQVGPQLHRKPPVNSASENTCCNVWKVQVVFAHPHSRGPSLCESGNYKVINPDFLNHQSRNLAGFCACERMTSSCPCCHAVCLVLIQKEKFLSCVSWS